MLKVLSLALSLLLSGAAFAQTPESELAAMLEKYPSEHVVAVETSHHIDISLKKGQPVIEERFAEVFFSWMMMPQTTAEEWFAMDHLVNWTKSKPLPMCLLKGSTKPMKPLTLESKMSLLLGFLLMMKKFGPRNWGSLFFKV